MRTLSVAFIFVSVIVFISSCQKEISWETNGRLNSDSTFLSKIIYLDTTRPAGQDTLTVILYEYDAQDRLLKITEFNNYNGVIDTYYTYFRYAGNDTLPVTMKNTGSSYDSSINYFRYSNGFVVYDSLVNYDGINNSVSTEKVISVMPLGSGRFLYKEVRPPHIIPGFPPTSGSVDSTIFSRTVANGNLIDGIDSIWSDRTYVDKKVIHYDFDQKKSPFKKVSFWYNGYYTEASLGIAWGVGNNPLFVSESWGGIGQFTTSISYDYNADEYPVIARIQMTGPWSLPDYNKLAFVYEKR
jgi:hypothetical protein